MTETHEQPAEGRKGISFKDRLSGFRIGLFLG
jgi:hypothetical protein